MNIYLEQREKDIRAFKKAIKLCNEDSKTVEVLKEYLDGIKREHQYADFLKKTFVPLIQCKDSFHCAYIYCLDSGDYSIEVYIHNSDKNSKEYTNIYDKFCNENEETFFCFSVYDIEKDKDIYEESIDYDKITIKPNKKNNK